VQKSGAVGAIATTALICPSDKGSRDCELGVSWIDRRQHAEEIASGAASDFCWPAIVPARKNVRRMDCFLRQPIAYNS
jgi:hypothetical protein